MKHSHHHLQGKAPKVNLATLAVQSRGRYLGPNPPSVPQFDRHQGTQGYLMAQLLRAHLSRALGHLWERSYQVEELEWVEQAGKSVMVAGEMGPE